MAFFIGVNLILTVLLIFTVLLLYLRQNRLIELEKKYDKLNRDLENSLAAFLIEIREENNEFIKKFQETIEQKSQSEKRTSPKEFIEDAPQYIQREEPLATKRKIVFTEKITENKKDKHPLENNETQTNEKSANHVLFNHEDLKRKVKTLLEAGFSAEEIAKQLDRGKTEINLLIKFDPELLTIERNLVKK